MPYKAGDIAGFGLVIEEGLKVGGNMRFNERIPQTSTGNTCKNMAPGQSFFVAMPETIRKNYGRPDTAWEEYDFLLKTLPVTTMMTSTEEKRFEFRFYENGFRVFCLAR